MQVGDLPSATAAIVPSMSTWQQLYEAMFKHQQRRVMAQVQRGVGGTPMLTAFGTLLCQSMDWAGQDLLIFNLAAGQGSAGSVMLQESDFQGFEEPSPNHLTVFYADCRILLTFQSSAPDMLQEDETADETES